MNDTFSFPRFGKYLVYDIKKAFSRYGNATILLVLFPILLVLFVNLFAFIFKGADYQWVTIDSGVKMVISIFVIGFFVISMPTSLYGNLTDKRSGSDWLMVPASRLEKYLSMMLILLIILPLITMGGSLLSDWIVSLLDKDSEFILKTYRDSIDINLVKDYVEINGSGVCWGAVMSLFSGILTYLLGAIWFKKHKVTKTIFCMIGLSILMSTLFSISLVNGFKNETIDEAELFDSIVNHQFAFNALLHAASDIPVIALMTLVWFRLKTLKH